MDGFTSYMYLWQGAVEFVSRTECFKNTQAITTQTGIPSYTLNADYLELFAKTHDNRYFVTLNDGVSDNHYLFYKDYSEILYRNQQNSVQYPYNFTIIDDPDPPAPVSGTASGTSVASGGQSVLTDSTADFSSFDAGDSVHDITDGSLGIILSKTSSTQLVTALFPGTVNQWSAGDAYEIVPQGRSMIVIDPPPSTPGYTISLPYVQRPAPVFSDYGVYRFQREYCLAVIMYAAWLYKYRDSKPNEGDKYYIHFDNQVKRYSYGISARYRTNNRMKVNMKAGRR
jgi:hypothetical protein